MSYLLLFLDGPHEGEYLRSYDPDFEGGRGLVTSTTQPELAQQFETAVEAFEEWKRPSKVHPIRLSDGKPNRPMSAWTVTTVKV